MGVLVNVALGALAGVVGSLLATTFGSSSSAVPIGILAGLVGYFAGGALAPAGPVKSAAASISEWEEADAAKKAKKAKKAAAEARKKEEANAAREAEAAEKKAAKAKADKKAKAAKAAAAVVAKVESEPEEEEVEAAPKSKSAIKKAKLKAKEAAAKAEAEAAAKAAAKKAKKAEKAGAAPAKAEAAAPAKVALTASQEKAAAKAAAAAAAADLDGWETIEATKPTKSQLAKSAAAAAAPAGKPKPIPSSERLLTEELIIPTKEHSLIIGKAGETLKKLSEGTGATIDMPKRESASAKIQITGTPAQVAAAKNAITSLVERGFSSITHPGILSDDITIDPKNIGLILGASGSTLRKIIEVTGAKINLPEKGSSSKKVLLVGEKEAVRAAKAALRSLIADGFSSITHPTWIKVEVDFPADKFGILIGEKGQTIKSIQGDTKARINLPEKGTKATTVSVCGEAAAVAKAQKQIEKLLEPLAPLPDPEEEDLATDDAWGQEHTAQGEDALWA